MKPALLDFSLRPELALHARVVADVEAVAAPMGIAIVITAAFAAMRACLSASGAFQA